MNKKDVKEKGFFLRFQNYESLKMKAKIDLGDVNVVQRDRCGSTCVHVGGRVRFILGRILIFDERFQLGHAQAICGFVRPFGVSNGALSGEQGVLIHYLDPYATPVLRKDRVPAAVLPRQQDDVSQKDLEKAGAVPLPLHLERAFNGVGALFLAGVGGVVVVVHFEELVQDGSSLFDALVIRHLVKHHVHDGLGPGPRPAFTGGRGRRHGKKAKV